MAKYYERKNDKRNNEKGIRLHLDLLDEARATTEQRMTRYQDLMAKHYNAKVKPQIGRASCRERVSPYV